MARTPRGIRRTKRELVKRLVAIAAPCRRWRDTRRRRARRTQKLLITRRAAHPRNARPRTPARAVRRGRRPGQPAGRVHRDQTPHPRASGCPLPSATGSSRVAERRKSARSQLASTTRALAGWRLVPACGKQEVDAHRSVDEQARPGGYWAEAMRGPHLKAGDVTGASRPRPESVPWRVRARSPRGALADVKIQLTGPTRPAGCPEPTGAVDGRWAVSCHVEARCGVPRVSSFTPPKGRRGR